MAAGGQAPQPNLPIMKSNGTINKHETFGISESGIGAVRGK